MHRHKRHHGCRRIMSKAFDTIPLIIMGITLLTAIALLIASIPEELSRIGIRLF